MKEEFSPNKNDIQEQAPSGAPGENVHFPYGLYKIYSALSGSKLVDMALSGDSNLVHNVKLFHDNAEPESTWIINRASGDYVIYNGKFQNLSLMVSGDNIVAMPENGLAKFRWSFKKYNDEFVYIQSGSDVMDVRGGNTADNTNIILWPYHGAANQRFKIVKV
ncbi:RICIN domain-containing protein [Pseudomonas brassicacearum]|uniref:RICIN domain-containing protein n=1 Tax=Pseudomonas brassicacearum TaxID=930166 RepID=UPI000F48B0AE|nr:RICIN domain-containing protein [Pseudomonas brassicacearum]